MQVSSADFSLRNIHTLNSSRLDQQCAEYIHQMNVCTSQALNSYGNSCLKYSRTCNKPTNLQTHTTKWLCLFDIVIFLYIPTPQLLTPQLLTPQLLLFTFHPPRSWYISTAIETQHNPSHNTPPPPSWHDTKAVEKSRQGGADKKCMFFHNNMYSEPICAYFFVTL